MFHSLFPVFVCAGDRLFNRYPTAFYHYYYYYYYSRHFCCGDGQEIGVVFLRSLDLISFELNFIVLTIL